MNLYAIPDADPDWDSAHMSTELKEKRIAALRSRLSASNAEFEYNVQRVMDLANFDKEYQRVALEYLHSMKKKIPEDVRHQSERNRIDALIFSFENMSKDQSLKEKYGTMYNQCLVLLVSHFGETLSEIYKGNIAQSIKFRLAKKSNENDFRVTFDELLGVDFNDDRDVGRFIVEKQAESFQDMQAICRLYSGDFGCKYEEDAIRDNIIFSQATRHIIVHAGAKVSSKFLRQIRNCNKRTLMTGTLEEGKVVEFTSSDLETVSSAMNSFISNSIAQIQANLEAAFNSPDKV